MSPLDAGLAEPDPMDVLAAEMRTNEEMHEVLLMLVGTVFALLSKDGEDEWADSMRADLWEYRDEVHAACEKWDFYRNSDSQFPISALSAVDPKILSKMLAEGHAFAYENVGEGGPKNADEAVLEAISTLDLGLYGIRKAELLDKWGEETLQDALRGMFGTLAPMVRMKHIMADFHEENRLTLLAEQGDIKGALPGWQVDGDDVGYTFGMDAEEMGGPRADCYRDRDSFASWTWRAQRDGHHFDGKAKTAREAMRAATAKMES